MLRPATPLSILLLAAFALMLLTVLSPPITEALPLGSFNGVKYGVFGSCKSTGCSSFSFGYDASTSSGSDWEFPSGIRGTMTKVLILHVAGAALTLIIFVMAIVAHIHSASHSARYLMAHFILSLLTVLVCVAAFVVDYVLFSPNMAMGSWFALAAAIVSLLGCIAVCINRNMMMSRKKRRRELDDRPALSATTPITQSFYNREPPIKAGSESVSTQPTIPLVSGANQSTAGSTPQYMTLEEDASDRMPLTQQSTTEQSADMQYADLGPQDPRRSESTSRNQRYPTPPTYGPDGAMGSMGAAGGAGRGGVPPRRSPAFDQGPGMRGRGGPQGGYRGRGGYGPRGGPYGGAYDQRGGDNGAGGGYGDPAWGYGDSARGYGPSRGGYAPQRGAPSYARGGQDGYRGGDGYVDERPGQQSQDYYGGALDPYGARSGSTGPYGRAQQPQNGGYPLQNQAVPNMGTQHAARYDEYDNHSTTTSELPRAESPPPLPEEGVVDPQTTELAAPRPESSHRQSFNYGLRESDVDVAGMIGLQQSRDDPRHHTYMTQSSQYSNDEQNPNQLVASRQGWSNSPRVPSPLHISARTTPTQNGTVANLEAAAAAAQPPPRQAAQVSNVGYDTADPRFGREPPSLATEYPGPRMGADPPPHAPADALPPLEDMPPPRHMSPGAESDRSNFTSISQRGVNPDWNPDAPPPMPMMQQGGMPGRGQGPPPMRRPQQARQDILLMDNPDFSLGPRKPRGGAGGRGSAYPNPSAL